MRAGLSLALLACVSCVTVPRGPEPGRYCRIDALVGDTGRETFPLGDFAMVAEVAKSLSGHRVWFTNSMPDSQQILSGEGDARLLANGDLQFDFEDGWGNLGRGRFSRSGVMTLEITRNSEDLSGRNVGRNYGRFELSRAACADPRVRSIRSDR